MTTTEKSAMSTKKKGLIIGGSIFGLMAVYFIYDYIFYVSTDNAQIQADTLIMTARVTGYVSKVLVEEGQKVKAGETLVEIDAKDYQSKSNQAENEEASLGARVKDAEINYHRIEALYHEGAVSQQSRDSALANFQELSRRQKALQANSEVSKNGLNDTQLRAPADGAIAKKSAEVGMLANPGTPLLGFVSNDSRWIIANFKETDLGRIKVGQSVSVEVDAIPGREFKGKVQAINPATGATFSLLPPDNATGNFTKVVQRVPTRINLETLSKDDIDLLRSGLSAIVKVRVR